MTSGFVLRGTRGTKPSGSKPIWSKLKGAGMLRGCVAGSPGESLRRCSRPEKRVLLKLVSAHPFKANHTGERDCKSRKSEAQGKWNSDGPLATSSTKACESRCEILPRFPHSDQFGPLCLIHVRLIHVLQQQWRLWGMWTARQRRPLAPEARGLSNLKQVSNLATKSRFPSQNQNVRCAGSSGLSVTFRPPVGSWGLKMPVFVQRFRTSSR